MMWRLLFTAVALFLCSAHASASTLKEAIYCDSPATYAEMVQAGLQDPPDMKTGQALLLSEQCFHEENPQPVKVVKKGKFMTSFKLTSGDTKTVFYTAPEFIN